MQIHIPAPLRVYTAQQDTVTVRPYGGEALRGLFAQYPELKKHLFTADNKLRSFVNLYLNDEDIRYLEGVADSGEGRRRAEHYSEHCWWGGESGSGGRWWKVGRKSQTSCRHFRMRRSRGIRGT